MGARFGMLASFVVLGGAGALAAWLASRVWPAHDPDVVEHDHPDLPAGHAHALGAALVGQRVRHSHAFVVDDHHPHWPTLRH